MVALLRERKGLGVGRWKAKVVADFLIGSAETGGAQSTPEAAHGIIALLDGSMILLNSIVEVLVVRCMTVKPKVRAGYLFMLAWWCGFSIRTLVGMIPPFQKWNVDD